MRKQRSKRPAVSGPILPLDEVPEFELLPDAEDPTGYTVLGMGDFVLGRVRRLLVDVGLEEVRYLVVDTTVSSLTHEKGVDRLVPIAWAELVGPRRQVRLPHLPGYRFARLPRYDAAAPAPDDVEFPRPAPDDPDWLESA